MLQKEFKKTNLLIETYNNLERDNEINEAILTDSNIMPLGNQEENIAKDSYFESEEYKYKANINETFKTEYYTLSRESKYFTGCPFKLYKTTYKDRLKKFEEIYQDSKEEDFISSELKTLNDYYFIEYIENELKLNISYSIQRTKEYLLEKVGYKLINSISSEGEVRTKAIKDSSTIELSNEILADLSNTPNKEKIIYLSILGILDKLKSENENISNNSIAKIISAITGIKASTCQSYINPILNKETKQDNNPINKPENVEKVKLKLIDLGIKL